MKLVSLIIPIIVSLINPQIIYATSLIKDEDISEQDKFKPSVEYLDQVPKDNYILGPGDHLKISVSPDLTELVTNIVIDGEGTAYLPLIRNIYVNGLSIIELTDLLNKSFKKYVKNPAVEAIVTRYRPLRVLIDGEVGNPGYHYLDGALTTTGTSNSSSFDTNNASDLLNKLGLSNIETIKNKASSLAPQSGNYYFPTVFDAIRTGGGVTPYSDLTKIQLIRQNTISKGGGKITTYLDFSKVIRSGDKTQNIRIYDSDIIKIARLEQPNDESLKFAISSNLNPRFVSVFVSGRVVSPGRKVVTKSSTLNDAIDFSGGTKVLKGKLKFIRVNSDGTIDKRKFAYKPSAKRGRYNNPYLQDGDLIFVGNNLLTTTNEVLSEITAPFEGLLSTYGVIKAIEDL